MNTYDNDTKCCDNSVNMTIPNYPNTIKDVIQENSNLIYKEPACCSLNRKK